jgi:thermitase
MLESQWGLSTPGFTHAWTRTEGDGVRVGVVDSGARHPEIREKIVARHDFVNNDSTVQDPLGHGTHVAGTIAAETGNGTGVASGCPGCQLVIGKAVGSDGRGYTSDIAEAIVWSTNKGAEVINLSLGGPASPTMQNAVDYAVNKGAVVVAAVGNDGASIRRYPAAYSNVIAVAATDRWERRASFSNYGDWVDVAAPGVTILSTVSRNSGYDGYDFYSGTSMAAPHVVALAGLLVGEGHGPDGVRRRILGTAKDLGPSGHDPYFGAGRIQADQAVR